MPGPVKVAAYNALEDALAAKLAESWTAYWTPLSRRLARAVKARDWDGAHEVIESIDLSRVSSKHLKLAETLGTASLILGAGNVLGTKQAERVYANSDLLVVGNAISQLETMLNRNAQAYLRKTGHALVLKLYKMSLEATPVIKARNPTPTPLVLPDGKAYDAVASLDGVRVRMDMGGRGFFGLTSGLQVNRLRSYGFLEQARERGVGRYRIQATLDEVTSQFCQHVHGRTFLVDDGWDHIQRTLATDDPDALAAIAPWPHQDEMALLAYDRMTAEDMVSEGLLLPPYHPHCRTIIVAVEQGEDDHEIEEHRSAVDQGMAQLLRGDAVDTGAGDVGSELGASRQGEIGGEETPPAGGLDPEAQDQYPGLLAGIASGLALSSVLFGPYSRQELEEVVEPEDFDDWADYEGLPADSEYEDLFKAEGNPYRDAEGKFTSADNDVSGSARMDDVTVYHGTLPKHLGSILQGGLKVSASKERRNYGNELLYEGARGESIYATAHADVALQYALNAESKSGVQSGFVLLKVEIPPSADMYTDEWDDSRTAVRLPQDIPPEWITGYKVFTRDMKEYDVRSGWTAHSVAKAEGRVVYLLVLPPKEVKKHAPGQHDQEDHGNRESSGGMDLDTLARGVGAAELGKFTGLARKLKEAMGTDSENLSPLYSGDRDVLSQLGEIVGGDVSEKDMQSAVKQFKSATDRLLRDLPETLTVYRGGAVRGAVASVTTSADTARHFASYSRGAGVLERYQVDKSKVLLAVSAVTGGHAYQESELLVRTEDLINTSVKKHLPGQHDQEDHGNWADGHEAVPKVVEHLAEWVNETAAGLVRDKGLSQFYVPHADAVKIVEPLVRKFLRDNDAISYTDDEEYARQLIRPAAAALLDQGLRGAKYSGLSATGVVNLYKKRPDTGSLEFEKLLRGLGQERKIKKHLPGQHDQEDHGNRGGGSVGALYHGASVDKLSYDENRQKLREIKEQVYDKDPAFRGAAEVVHWYISSDQTKGLMTRSIVEGALKGKSVDEILADPKVTKYIEQYNSARIPEVHVGRSVVETLVSSAPGYYSTLRGSEHAADTLYRGCKDLRSAQPGKEFELRGPTAVSHSRDIALSYSGGVLLEIEKGAHALPSRALETVRSYAQTGDEYDTLPVFYQRSENAVHPKGVGHGFSIDWDTDRELTTSGRFEVVSTEKKTLSYEDAVTGKTKSRTFTVHKVRQTGVF